MTYGQRGLPHSQNDIFGASSVTVELPRQSPVRRPFATIPCALIVAQPSARAPPLRVPFAAQALLHCMPQPLCPVGPLSVPKHAGTHVHPSHPSHRGCIRFRSGKRLPGFYETMLGCISTCSLRAFQRSHSRVRQPPSRLSGLESGVQNQVRPPVLTATLYPDRGTAEPSCTPLRVPRAAQAPMHRMPHSPSPGGTSSPPRARAYP